MADRASRPRRLDHWGVAEKRQRLSGAFLAGLGDIYERVSGEKRREQKLKRQGSAASRGRAAHDFEDDRTFGEFLGPLPPAVEGDLLVRGASRDGGARRAVGRVRDRPVRARVGRQGLVDRPQPARRDRAAARRDGPPARRPCSNALPRARRPARRHGPGVDAEGEEIRARQVIVAAQAPHAAPLVASVAVRAADALSALTDGAFLSVAVETSETTAMPYDDVYAIATPGRVFDMFINQAHALRAHGPRRPGGSLMLFAGAHAAEALMREPNEVIVERFLADLHGLFPQTRGAIAGATAHRWQVGNVYARPGRGRLQPALEGPLGPHANLHLAGDYFAELGTMEAAARTGHAAAERADARLREVTHV